MLVLALDTTSRAGSVAVVDDDRVMAVVRGDPERTHGERLPAEIDSALRSAGRSATDLDLLAVASGPGAFTGLRIGLAAVQGLALVLRIPAIGVSALDALAEAAIESAHPAPEIIATWMDAARGEVFAARYAVADGAWVQPTEDPWVAAPDAVVDAMPAGQLVRAIFIGDGATRYREVLMRSSGGAARIFEAPATLAPLVARIGRVRALSGHAGPPHALQPLYVRRPDAELAKATDITKAGEATKAPKETRR
jgi:tRNA threonylcarbamoyladenosine biosynthesis protein TsaB